MRLENVMGPGPGRENVLALPVLRALMLDWEIYA